mmetsp:Transcript_582/g.1856  ORF Transcript_582/g.1856 Transcript_582/m.1856 type:complete len:185 (-) Transcript_582:415-969(-)
MSSMEVPSGTTVEAESGIFAQRLMDAWGVGEAACNNGVLLLLSRDDRRMHVATGRGAAGALPDNVIDEIIAGVRPELKEGNYAGAVTRSVVDIGHALSGDRPQGPSEVMKIVMWVLGIGAMVGAGFWCEQRKLRRQNEWNECRKKLTQLERDRAQAWANAYQATSCPICLEDFAAPSAEYDDIG